MVAPKKIIKLTTTEMVAHLILNRITIDIISKSMCSINLQKARANTKQNFGSTLAKLVASRNIFKISEEHKKAKSTGSTVKNEYK